MIPLLFSIVLSAGVAVAMLAVDPIVVVVLVGLTITGALLTVYGILSLRAKVEVAKIHAARPAPMPQQAPPVVVVPSRLVLDPVEDGRRWLAQGRGDVVVQNDRRIVEHDYVYPPARQHREWRVVND